ncbi:MAG: hypothetical protein QMD97_04380 [Candidatus Aenigmarchaeota archaeon]|nr:hypothetical protein [Candidatus Aenigmarchaeota archaeon]
MKKLKVYLDTNMIHDLFTKQAEALRHGKEPEKPKKFAFMLEHRDKFEFITSFLTKAEIMRELVSAHGLKLEKAEEFWFDFMDLLKPKYIQKFEFDDQIVDIVLKVKMKLRTMVNFFHLFIAIKEEAYFVSGDKQILEKIKEAKTYDKLLTYVELQKLAANYVSYEES